MIKQIIVRWKIRKIVSVIEVLDEAEKHIRTIKEHLQMCRNDGERIWYINNVYRKFKNGGLFKDVRRIHR